jgi:potassium-transporting ATPase KdpC subunit
MKKNSTGFVALRLLIVLTLVCGGVYPGLITLIVQGSFPEKAGGSLVVVNGRIAGSKWLAQSNPGPGYLHARPSSCSNNTMPGSGSNFAFSSTTFRDSVSKREDRFRKDNGLSVHQTVPSDMLFASGSGLDPHISPDAARLQAARIALARHLNVQERHRLEEWVDRMIEPRQFGFLGERRVNVFLLNYLLDNSKGFNNFKE